MFSKSTMVDALLTVTVFVTLCVSACATELAKCHMHNPTEDGELKIEQDLHGNGIVVIGNEDYEEKILCITQNYCEITWKKDGWPINTTHSVLIEEEGQRLKFTKLRKSDEGQYSCEASNGRSTITGRISFYVISKDCNDKIAPINKQNQGCQNISAQLGEDVGFDCLFYLGHNYDPDQLAADWFKVNESAAESAYIDQYWTVLETSAMYNVSEYHQGTRDNRTNCANCWNCQPDYGTRLAIRNISAEAYGRYVLRIYSAGRIKMVILNISEGISLTMPTVDQEEWNDWLIFPVVSLLAFTILVSAVWRRFKVDIKLRWKNLSPRSPEDQLKENDVYLSYDWNSESDRAFAIELYNFLTDLGYRVFFEAHCLPGGVTDEDIYQALRISSRCVMIFSPDYLDSYRNFDVILAMDNAQRYKKEIIPIIYRDISTVPEEKRESALIREILSMPSLRYDKIPSQPLSGLQKLSQGLLGYPRSKRALHRQLLLRLPPPDRSSRHSAHNAIDSLNLISQANTQII